MGVEKAGQIGMVEPPSGARGDGGFGVEGDTDPGGGQHRQVIGAVADSHRLLQWNGMFGSQGEQSFPLALSGHDRWRHRAGDAACRQIKSVGDDVIEPELQRQRLRQKS